MVWVGVWSMRRLLGDWVVCTRVHLRRNSAGQSSSGQRRQLRGAFPPRRAVIKRAIKKAVQWLQNLAPRPPRAARLTANTWGRANCPFSTSHNRPPAQDYKYSASDPLRISVRRPLHRAPKQPRPSQGPVKDVALSHSNQPGGTHQREPPLPAPPLHRKGRTEFKLHFFSPPQCRTQSTCNQRHPNPQRTHTVHLLGKELSTMNSPMSTTSHSHRALIL